MERYAELGFVEVEMIPKARSQIQNWLWLQQVVDCYAEPFVEVEILKAAQNLKPLIQNWLLLQQLLP